MRAVQTIQTIQALPAGDAVELASLVGDVLESLWTGQVRGTLRHGDVLKFL